MKAGRNSLEKGVSFDPKLCWSISHQMERMRHLWDSAVLKTAAKRTEAPASAWLLLVQASLISHKTDGTRRGRPWT